MDGSQQLAIAENIALLSLLTRIPEAPAQNPAVGDLEYNGQKGRTFTFERERDVVDNLAFLSAASDNPEKVTAICIEEHANARGCTVRIAVNKGSLSVVEEGFQRISSILEKASLQEDNAAFKRSPFMAIISLNRGRLLSRLRSQHAQKSIRIRNKLTISARLEEAVHLSMDYTTVLASSGIDVIAIEAKAGRFQTTFRELEEKGSEIGISHLLLANLVNCAYTLATKLQLGNLLNVLPNKQLGPSERESLLIGIQKIRRYKSACEFLFLVAQKLEIFQKVEIEAISLPVSATELLEMPDYVPSLIATLARINGSSTYDINQLCASLERKVDVLPASAQHEFEQRVPRVLGSSKIHVEIQILYHYEMHPVKIRPRVICSSKSACFLCDLFIKLHGKFYIARTHGRLYKQRRLPVIRGLPLSSTQLQY